MSVNQLLYLNSATCAKYQQLKLKEDKVLLTYIWRYASEQTLRSKVRIVTSEPKGIDQVPAWATGTMVGMDFFFNPIPACKSWDVHLEPVALYPDPIRGGKHKLVLCDIKPAASTNISWTSPRMSCLEVMSKVTESHDPWFGIEQEYNMMDPEPVLQSRPLGFPLNGFPAPVGPHFCGIGAGQVVGRHIADAHLNACIYAGVAICGQNAEALPGQWEYQVGPSPGLTIGDDLWMSRYLLHRVAEDFNVKISFDPKPVPGWSGSGGHTNFSTKQTRAPGGMAAIEEAVQLLGGRHQEHLKKYDPNNGADNARRLTGLNETSSMGTFSSGIGNRACSVRIPQHVADDGSGYLEDRRPASNCDPYSVAEIITRTVCLRE